MAIAATGALTVLAAAMIASAIQGWLGILGTGLVILLLVVVGNPGSGGIYAPEFLPDGLRGMHRWNVPGLANDLTKSAVYFHGRAALWPAVGLAVWAVVGAAGLLTATLVRGRRAAVPTRVGPAPARRVGRDDAGPLRTSASARIRSRESDSAVLRTHVRSAP